MTNMRILRELHRKEKKLSNCTVQLALGGWVGPGGRSFFEDLVIFQNHDLKFIIFFTTVFFKTLQYFIAVHIQKYSDCIVQ